MTAECLIFTVRAKWLPKDSGSGSSRSASSFKSLHSLNGVRSSSVVVLPVSVLVRDRIWLLRLRALKTHNRWFIAGRPWCESAFLPPRYSSLTHS